MTDKIESRLQELQTEYRKGQERLAVLEQEMANVQNSMLRISGAIQVLQELLQKEEARTEPAPALRQNDVPETYG